HSRLTASPPPTRTPGKPARPPSPAAAAKAAPHSAAAATILGPIAARGVEGPGAREAGCLMLLGLCRLSQEPGRRPGQQGQEAGANEPGASGTTHGTPRRNDGDYALPTPLRRDALKTKGDGFTVPLVSSASLAMTEA